jgi:hypothetical protein
VRPLRPLAAPDPTRRDTAFVVQVEDELLVFLADGSVIGRAELAAGERATGSTGGDAQSNVLVVAGGLEQPWGNLMVGVRSSLFPTHPHTRHVRLRLFRPGRPPVEHDVVLEPGRATEILWGHGIAALALFRPLPLVAASALSPLPSDEDDAYAWWWRDPWLSGGRYAGWLLATLALAALLAWRARRAARERCATALEVHVWTAAVFLLGPVGLLWMRLVLPRLPVEPVGGARRAVHLERSPSSSAPWPEPAREGIEVFS